MQFLGAWGRSEAKKMIAIRPDVNNVIERLEALEEAALSKAFDTDNDEETSDDSEEDGTDNEVDKCKNSRKRSASIGT